MFTDSEYVNKFTRDVALRMFTTFLGILFVAVMVIYYWSTRVTKRLKNIQYHIIDLPKDKYEKEYVDDSLDEIGELSRSVEDMRKTIGYNENTKQEMLQNVSHDFKTPIAVIKSYAEAYQDGMAGPEAIDTIIEKKKKKKKKEQKIPINGENVETSIDVALEESFYGLEKKVSLRTVDGKMKVFTITIPAGIRNGEKIRLLRQGKEGKNGGKNGDLFIKINVTNNKKFKLKGNDLYTDLYLTPWEAALGTKAQVSSIDEPTQVYIPEGIQTGEVIRIPGKGYKDGKGGRGDLIAEIKVMVPKKLSSEERNLFENLNRVSTFNPRNN